MAVVGTAGHIDHGKSALVKALTGTEPDRLPEERKRGITIQLGYAPLTLPSGRVVSVVDVPGHERFIKTMASGAAVVDLAMLVIDAGDGVKPQSIEHLGILRALDVDRGILVMTKCDTVDPDLAELAAEEARELVQGTFLEDAPLIMTSALTGQGLPELREGLDELVGDFREAVAHQPVRMPIDRAFVMPGFGTVVTGTLLGGVIQEADTVQVQPEGVSARVRGVQVHGGEASRVHAPARTALNLAGVELDAGLRGQWIVTPGDFRPATSILALAACMDWISKPIRLPAAMALNLGSASINCEIHGVSDGPRQKPLVPGKSHLVRVDTEGPVVARADDRFVLRVGGGLGSGFSTAAGGRVIDPLWGKRRLTRRLEQLALSLGSEDPAPWIDFAVDGTCAQGLDLSELTQRVPTAMKVTQRAMQEMLRRREVVKTGKNRLVAARHYARALERTDEALKNHHEQHPERTGIKRDALRDRSVGREATALFDSILSRRVNEKAWKLTGDLVAEASHVPRSDSEIAHLSEQVLERISRDPSSPPTVKALASELGSPPQNLKRAIDLLVGEGRTRLLDGELLFTSVFLEDLGRKVRAFFESNEKMMITDLKTIASVTRKHALPLARWLDDEGITVRRGDFRILKG